MIYVISLRVFGGTVKNHSAAMASTQELKSVIKETLENRGVLGQIKARIRAEVFNALEDQSEEKPPLTNENLIINELIREYLEFNKYKYTSSVLLAESGQPQNPLDREFLASELNLLPESPSSPVPLLYHLVGHFQNKSRSGRPKSKYDGSEQEPVVVHGTR